MARKQGGSKAASKTGIFAKLAHISRNARQVLVSVFLVCGVWSVGYLLWLPDVTEFAKVNPKTTAYIELRREQAQDKGKKFSLKMRWVPLSAISPNMVHAVILSEDGGFYRHKGIDWKELHNALKRDIERRKLAFGGSTITQQLARNLYLSPSKNPLRKIKEAIIARQLEKKLGKKRILELYLNVAEWGNGVFGVEAAANAYFGHGAGSLTPEESVALASILPSPRKWSPFSSGRRMSFRRNSLLGRMRRSGYLTDEAAKEYDEDDAAAPAADAVIVPVPSSATAADFAPVSTDTVVPSAE